MKTRIATALAFTLGGGLLLALIGALFGIHNPVTPYVPSGGEGALFGAGFGLLLGALLAGVARSRSSSLARGLTGAAFAAIPGLVFGLRGPYCSVPAGLPGALVGALLGAALLLLFRFRVVLGLLACLWTAGLANPDRYAAPADAAGGLAQLPSGSESAPETEALSSYDVTPRPIGLIPPGTVIDDRPPGGWSNLVLKTHFKVATGPVDRFSSALADAIASIFIATLAKVELAKESGAKDGGITPPGYRIAEVAIGAGTRIKGQDTIVSSQSRAKQGAELGILGLTLLAQHETRWPTILIRARSNTMVLFDDSTYLHKSGGHHPVVLRYALLADPKTGRLESLVWRVDGSDDAGYQGAVGPLEWLPAGKVDHCPLHVDAARVRLGFPTQTSALAIPGMPPGHTQLPLPADWRESAGLPRFTPPQAREMEQRLRQLVRDSP